MGFFEDEAPSGSGNAGDCVRGVDSGALHDAFVAAVRRGWLLSLGGSRDGYSVSVALFADGKLKQRKYYTEVSELQEALESILEAAERPPEAKKAGKPR